MRPAIHRMPEVAKALIYVPDLKEAAERLGKAWNTSQVVEALNAIHYWHNKIADSLKGEKE